MAVAALTMFAACDNSMYEYDELFPEAVKRVVCIKQDSKGAKELFNVGKDDYVDFTILRSGGIPEDEASVKIEVMSQEELSLYDENYVLADASIVSLSASKMNFKANERYQILRATFTADGIQNCADQLATLEPGKILCLAFKLVEDGNTSIDGDKNYVIRELSVNEPQLNFNFAATYVNGPSTTVDVNLPFANEDFTIDWTFDVKSADYTGMEPSTAFGNGLAAKYVAGAAVNPVVEGTNSMGAGETTASYTISLPDGTAPGIYDVQVTFGDAVLDGGKDMLTNYAAKAETYTMYIRFDTRTDHFIYKQPTDDANRTAGIALTDRTVLDHANMKFIPGSSWSSFDWNKMFDNNTTSHWENRWSSGGWGPTTVPFNAVVDLGSKQDVTAMEYWRRDGTYYYDTKGFEVYAAETADYSAADNLQFDGLTYLGYYEAAGQHGNRMTICEFPKVNTQYLVIRYTNSNRGNSVNCCELRFWN